MRLQTFLEQEFAKPFVWGETDCAAMADRWVEVRAGFSPLAVYGRRHADEAGARRWMAEPGGYGRAVIRVMRAAKLTRVRVPREGDLGLVELMGRLCVAIRAGQGWIARDEKGFFAGPAGRVRVIWRVEARA